MRLTEMFLRTITLGLFVSTTAQAQSALPPPPAAPPGPGTAPPKAEDPPSANALNSTSTPRTPPTIPMPVEAHIPKNTISERRSPMSLSISGPGDAKPMTEIPRWYGWQTALALAPGDALMIVGILQPNHFEGSWARFLGHIFSSVAAPIVHASHGHIARGFGSLAMNTTVPFLGFVIEALIGTKAYIVPIFGLTTLATQAVDVAFLSRDTVPVPLENRPRGQAHGPFSIGVVPMMDTQRKGVWLVGQF
jgi:hypothetical protein